MVSTQVKDTEQDLRGQRRKSTMAFRVGRGRGRRGRPVANAEVMEAMQ